MLSWDSWEFLESEKLSNDFKSWLHSKCDNQHKIIVLHQISSQISQMRQMKNSLIIFILSQDAHQGIVTVPSVHHVTFHTGVQMMESFQVSTQSWNHGFRGAGQACQHVVSQKCWLYHEVLQEWSSSGMKNHESTYVFDFNVFLMSFMMTAKTSWSHFLASM